MRDRKMLIDLKNIKSSCFVIIIYNHRYQFVKRLITKIAIIGIFHPSGNLCSASASKTYKTFLSLFFSFFLFYRIRNLPEVLRIENQSAFFQLILIWKKKNPWNLDAEFASPLSLEPYLWMLKRVLPFFGCNYCSIKI